MKQQLITKGADATKLFAAKLASTLKGGEVLLLRGDLGSGKTTFTQGLAEALGVKRKITSPTFIVMRSYELPSLKGNAKYLYHLDLYRMESYKDIEGLGLEELLGNEENIIAIEWPEKIKLSVSHKSILLNFRYIDEMTREITQKDK